MEKNNAINLKQNDMGPTIYWHQASITWPVFLTNRKNGPICSFTWCARRTQKHSAMPFLDTGKCRQYEDGRQQHLWGMNRGSSDRWDSERWVLSLRDSRLGIPFLLTVMGGCGAVESTPVGQSTYLKSSNNIWLKPSEITYNEISFCKMKFLKWTGVFFFFSSLHLQVQ